MESRHDPWATSIENMVHGRGHDLIPWRMAGGGSAVESHDIIPCHAIHVAIKALPRHVYMTVGILLYVGHGRCFTVMGVWDRAQDAHHA